MTPTIDSNLRSSRISPRALLRRLRRPRQLGQKRYILYRTSRRSSRWRSDPGYIGAFLLALAGRPGHLSFQEEIAVQANNNRLYWIVSGPPIRTDYYGIKDLRRARKLRRTLNRKPLGVDVSQAVNPNGYLVVALSRRAVSGYVHDLAVRETDSKNRSFDITVAAEADDAVDYYRLLKVDAEEALAWEVESATESLRSSDIKHRRLFADRATADRITQSEQFARALAQGNLDAISGRTDLEEISAGSTEADNNPIQADRRRTQKTIDALSRQRPQ